VFIGGVLYVILAGSTNLASGDARLYALNAIVICAAVVAAASACRRADRVDASIVAGLLAFLVTCILSRYPRISLDSAYVGIGYASFVIAARRTLATDSARTWLLRSLAVVGCLVCVTFLLGWGWSWAQWSSLAGKLPPMGLFLETAGFGYRNDVSLMLALLAGAVWTSRDWLGRAITAAVLTVDIVLVVMAGSRMVWLSAALATLAAVAPAIRWSSYRHAVSVGPRLVIAAMVGVLVLAVAVPLAWDRLTTTDTLAARNVLWTTSLSIWQQEPLAGIGPGAFAVSFPLAEPAVTFSFAPEHPDNALVQTLTESGMIGVAGLLVAGYTFLRGWRPPGIVIYAGVLILLNGLTSNPMLNGFQLMPAMALFAAYRPVTPEQGMARSSSSTWRRTAWAVGVAAVLAGSSSVLGHAAYALAADANSQRAYDRADGWLSLSIAIDPGLAISWRERGLLRSAQGDYESGLGDILTAHRLVPTDTSTSRAAALAALRAGDRSLAVSFADLGASLRPASESDIAMAAWVRAQARYGNKDLLSRLIMGSPWAVASPTWTWLSLTEEASSAAFARAVASALNPTAVTALPGERQPVWLGLLAANRRLLADAEASGFVEIANQGPLLRVARCDPAAAAGGRTVTAGDAVEPMYWAGIVLGQQIEGLPVETTVRLANLATHGGLHYDERPDSLIRDVERDRWAYALEPLLRSEFAGLGSVRNGLLRLLGDPRGALPSWITTPACLGR
jgi:O-antigen ligase